MYVRDSEMKINAVSPIPGSYKLSGNQNKEKIIPKVNYSINNLPNNYYMPLSFGRSLNEHKSWGAVINPETKEVTFKIFTYPDTKGVTVTVIKKNQQNQKKVYELQNKGNGIFETRNNIPKGEIEAGDKYFYTIYKGNGDIDRVKDPYSFRQKKLLGESVIYDHSKYNWNDKKWYTENKDRISRRANSENGLKSVNEASIYELNIPSFTKEGTFKAAKKRLKAIKDLGFNAIEIMPAENTYSFNWGYDGVDKLAPSEYLGGPDALKSLIDYSHSIGLNVIMDMVPNHLGPDGASLVQTGPYIKGNNCFGGAFNFEGENSQYVRDFIVNAALNWINNYHCDGLRLDMTKFMESDYTMKQIAAEVNYHNPDAFLIAEDARSSVSVDESGNFYDNWDEPHDKRVTNPLKQYESAQGDNEYSHCNAIKQISDSNTSLGRLGYDSEWDFFFFHTLKDGLYGILDLDKLEKACYCSQDRVKYVMSHDEIGNLEGTRLIAKLMVPMLHLIDNVILNDNDKLRAEKLSQNKNMPIESALETVRNQKAQFTAEKLAIMLQTGKLEKYNTIGLDSLRAINLADRNFRNQVLTKLDINPLSGINYELLKTMFTKSLNKNKQALALIYSIPGPKMVFQGDERADLTPFRFFRKFQSQKSEPYLYTEKGYDTGKAALSESKLGSISYYSQGRSVMNKANRLTKDLNTLANENKALTTGTIIPENTVKHPASQVFAFHTKENQTNNEIFTVTNFNDSDYPRNDAANYYIKFPQGKWTEILNTDDKKYNGSGNFNNRFTIQSDGIHNSPIKMSGLSTCIFKRIG